MYVDRIVGDIKSCNFKTDHGALITFCGQDDFEMIKRTLQNLYDEDALGLFEEDGDADITNSARGVSVMTRTASTRIFNDAEVIEDEPIFNGYINGISISVFIDPIQNQIER